MYICHVILINEIRYRRVCHVILIEILHVHLTYRYSICTIKVQDSFYVVKLYRKYFPPVKYARLISDKYLLFA